MPIGVLSSYRFSAQDKQKKHLFTPHSKATAHILSAAQFYPPGKEGY